MNRKEIKNLLNRRKSLLDIYVKLEIDSNNDSATTSAIYKNSRNNISDTIREIDMHLLEQVKSSVVGEWLLKINGMTPDIAAGLLAYFNIKGKDCAAQFIKYSGSDNYNNPHNSNLREIMENAKNNFKSNPKSLYGKLNRDKLSELLNSNIEYFTAQIRADRYMRKVFISHLFEEMYREEHDGELPDRYYFRDCVIIEPEVPYTK